MPSDPLADKPLYPSTHADGIPDLPHAPLSTIPQTLIPYRTRLHDSIAADPDALALGGALQQHLHARAARGTRQVRGHRHRAPTGERRAL